MLRKQKILKLVLVKKTFGSKCKSCILIFLFFCSKTTFYSTSNSFGFTSSQFYQNVVLKDRGIDISFIPLHHLTVFLLFNSVFIIYLIGN